MIKGKNTAGDYSKLVCQTQQYFSDYFNHFVRCCCQRHRAWTTFPRNINCIQIGRRTAESKNDWASNFEQPHILWKFIVGLNLESRINCLCCIVAEQNSIWFSHFKVETSATVLKGQKSVHRNSIEENNFSNSGYDWCYMVALWIGRKFCAVETFGELVTVCAEVTDRYLRI